MHSYRHTCYCRKKSSTIRLTRAFRYLDAKLSLVGCVMGSIFKNAEVVALSSIESLFKNVASLKYLETYKYRRSVILRIQSKIKVQNMYNNSL